MQNPADRIRELEAENAELSRKNKSLSSRCRQLELAAFRMAGLRHLMDHLAESSTPQQFGEMAVSDGLES